MPDTITATPASVVRRLQDATNSHDIDAIVACFAPEYRNETPAHPLRSFVGTGQVRRNWTQILAAVPDITADIVDLATEGNRVWTEWEHRGTRPDGSIHLMRGIVVFAIVDQRIASARFFLEPVDDGSDNADAALGHQLRSGVRQ